MPEPSAKFPPHKMGVFTLIMVTSALFMTLRNMPMMAETGLQMIFFNVVTVFAFLIPVALVSAELATGWPHNGVYHWVRAAFSNRVGYLAVWLQWVQSMFGMTSILAYVAASLAYVISPELGSNKYFIVGVILAVYWTATFANFHGTKLSGLISSVCVLSGVFIPTLFLIFLSFIYLLKNGTVHLNLSLTTQNLFPSIHDSKNLILFLSFIFGFVGVEVSASHARDVKDPNKNYPVAIFVAAIIGFVLTLLGGMAIAVVMPSGSYDLMSGAVQTFRILLADFHMAWLFPFVAFLVAFGAAGQVSTWVIGPVKGLFAAGQAGNLHPVFQQVNKKGIPHILLILQACIISLIGIVFLLVPNLNNAFLILTNTAVLLYSIMYGLMFVSAIRLRYTHPEVPRAYRVPGGNFGMWIVAGMGLVTAASCFAIGFIPSGLGSIPVAVYEIVMVGFVLALVTLPFFLYRLRKKRWR